MIIILLHILDRQIEFTARTDFLWQTKLKVEQEEVETMRGINKILLENILPAHVAEHFLQQRKTQVSSQAVRITQVEDFACSVVLILAIWWFEFYRNYTTRDTVV